MSVNTDTLNGIIRYCKDDPDDMDMVVRAMEAFEDYHQAIYRLEITRRLYSCGALDPETYRTQTQDRDRTRTVAHNALLGQVSFLNRLAEEAGLPPFYDGVVSEERPFRREVADAILEFVRDRIVNRI